MTIADKNLQKLCNEIMTSNNSTEGEKVRPKYADGSPSHTIFVNQVFEKYDLSKGELPIVTLRQTAWKSGIKEILWIYQDQTNDLDILKDKYGIFIRRRTLLRLRAYTLVLWKLSGLLVMATWI